MASPEEEGKLTDIQITDLAANIGGNSMEAIAEGLLGISPARLQHKKDENKGSTEGFNRGIIRMWSWQHGEGNQINVRVFLSTYLQSKNQSIAVIVW